MNLLVNFVLYGCSWCFEVLKLHSRSARAYLGIFGISPAPINHEIHSRLYDFRNIPYHTLLYHSDTIPYHTIPHYTIPHHAILYHTTPYHTKPYHTMPYHTMNLKKSTLFSKIHKLVKFQPQFFPASHVKNGIGKYFSLP